MVFRKDSKIDAFQRQISALRQQLGTVPNEADDEPFYGDREADEPQELAPVRVADGPAAPAPTDARPAPTQGYEAFTPYSAPARRFDLGEEPPPYSTPIADAQTSVIAHDTTWKGDLQSDGTIHVHGRVEGSIRAKQDVFVAEEADVDATITATNVVVAGSIKGMIRCGARFEALPQARIAGEIQAPTFVVHDGAAVNGQFRMGPGEGTEAAKPAVVQRRAARGGA
jgi:cytoskeletal protein CcmA (bactofilin family)